MSSRLGEKLRNLGFKLGNLISRQSRTTTEVNVGVKQLNRSIKAISKEKIGSEIQVLPEYRLAKKLVEENCPVVFVTGGAGTGKSTFIDWLQTQFSGSLVLSAPTGLAALNIGGVTLHKLCGFPPAYILNEDIKVFTRSPLRKASALVIDEISMVNANVLDSVDKFLRKNRRRELPFGGLTLILVGDLFQLPPVITSDVEHLFKRDYESNKFYGSKSLQNTPYYSIELNKAFRQRQQEFVDLLCQIREGKSLSNALRTLNTVCEIQETPPHESIVLSPRNNEVDTINNSKLNELNGRAQEYVASLEGQFSDRALPVPEQIELKVGAQVLLKKNFQKYVNGDLATVTKLGKISVTVRLHRSNEEVEIPKLSWEQYSYEIDPESGLIMRKVVGKYAQIPLILAWAMTIHKSQGLTLDKVHLNLGRGAFETGQTYVALSRSRTIEGLTLSRKLTTQDVLIDAESKDFYNKVREVQQKLPNERLMKEYGIQ